MISIIRKTGLLSIVMMLQMNFTGCASMVLGFSAEPITATIVDAETKQPLKDVIVVAHWQLVEGGFLDSSVPAGELMVMEAVTDAEGKFHFPAWGPKYDFMGRMKTDDPQLIIFKPGYKFRVLTNEWISSEIRDYQAMRRSDWDGKTIRLSKASDDLKKYGDSLYDLSSTIDGILRFGFNDDRNCFWKKTPAMLVAMHKESMYLENNGVTMFHRAIFSIQNIPSNNICGDPVEYLREYF